MVERTNIPSSPACGQWETLLADALDGLLSLRRGHLQRTHGHLRGLHGSV
jgi:hypothetical protein